MNRIDQLFKDKKEGILSIYVTAGFPNLQDTTRVLKALEQSGADMVELGMPFSDPLADGPVIQNSSQIALENGMSMEVLFRQLKEVRNDLSLPLILMGYLNPVLQYGFGPFLEKCVEVGIDGIILPDLPLEVYEKEYKSMFERCGLHYIMLITPQTSKDRVRKIASNTGGFLYMVAASSTTGAKKQIEEEQIAYFERIKNMRIRLPRLIGFGISSAATFRKACDYADGAIIGSAFIKAIGEKSGGSLESSVENFIRSILQNKPS